LRAEIANLPAVVAKKYRPSLLKIDSMLAMAITELRMEISGVENIDEQSQAHRGKAERTAESEALLRTSFLCRLCLAVPACFPSPLCLAVLNPSDDVSLELFDLQRAAVEADVDPELTGQDFTEWVGFDDLPAVEGCSGNKQDLFNVINARCAQRGFGGEWNESRGETFNGTECTWTGWYRCRITSGQQHKTTHTHKAHTHTKHTQHTQ